MTTTEFLTYLRSLDIKVWADGDRLRYNAPDGALTPTLREELVRRKGEILKFLREASAVSRSNMPPIVPASRDGTMHLSSAQQRLWFLDQLYPGSPVYNIPIAVRLTGWLHVAALEQSLGEIVRRHEALRTTFVTVSGQPVQVIAPVLRVTLPLLDLRNLPDTEREAEAERLAAEEAQQPFDLAQGPLLRVTLLRLGDAEHTLLLTMHHIVSDGWSMGVFFKELTALYAAYASGTPSPLPELSIQYVDFAAWQREWLQGEVLETQLAYWKDRLGGQLPALQLPTDRSRAPVQTFRGATYLFALSKPLTEGLRALSRQEGVTLFITLLAAFKVLLYRYTGQTDILVGSPIANRNRREIEGLIGFFVNTLVLRTDLSGRLTFRRLLERVREVALGAYANQDFPFEKLVGELQPERNLSRQPLFQVMFVLQETSPTVLEMPGLTLRPVGVGTGTAKFDLTLSFEEKDQELVGNLEYSTDLFEAATVARMAGHFQSLLEGIVANPDRQFSELPLLTTGERQQLLIEWSNTRTDYPRDASIHKLFEAQVEQTPEAVAVVFKEEKLTYRELNRRANRLAHHLQGLGVGPEVRVGIGTERSLEMIVGMLGVLKAGGAYVPLDPTYPKERLRFMLEDTQALVLLIQERLMEGSPEHSAKVVILDTVRETLSHHSEENPISSTTADSLAYVVYTSGSTGEPKGVSVIHRGVVRLVKGAKYVDLTAEEVFLQSSPISFDASTFEIWGCLLNGAQLVLFPSSTPSLAELRQVLQRHRVTTLWLTAGLFHLIVEERVEDLRYIRQLLAGGDVLSVPHVEKALHTLKDCRLINGYGPTEGTTFTCCYPIANAGQIGPSVPIGRPIGNTQVYVLDRNLQLVPVGIPGELYIGGDGLARDYLNRPDLTAEKFIPNPFSSKPGDRLYKTGDLVRYLPDGNIEFLGRRDYQVKIRGFRVELGEIEVALEQHPAVRETVVLAQKDSRDGKRLVAYVVRNQDPGPTIGALQSYLKENVPDYMVPSAFVFLDSLPLTPNGKVDRNRLPAPDRTRPGPEESFVAPRTQAETVLTDIWAKVLALEQVGVDDNFFELGGDSILSIQIVARAAQAGFQLTPRQLFQHQTIAELAAVAGIVPATQGKQGFVTGRVPLTPIQHWFFEQNLPDPHHWNLPTILEVQQPLDPVLLEQAVQHLVRHHDALRLRFVRTESGWQQFHAAPEASVHFTLVNLSTVPEVEREQALEAAATDLQASLNLSEGPLVQVALFDLGPEQARHLLLIVHHLVVDGVSWLVLLEDLQTAYQQLSRGESVQLPPKTTSYKQWAERLTEYARSPILKQELDYWLDKARTWDRRLPVDNSESRDAGTEASARTVSVSLGAEETRALLQDVPSVYRTQINDVLLTALVQAFARWTGLRSLLVDLEGHGREEIVEDADLSRTVGWFTTIFPVLLDLGEAAWPGDALQSIKEQLQRIPNWGIGYGLLRYLRADAEIAERLRAFPQASVSFNYLGQLDQALAEYSMFRPACEDSPFGSACGHSRPAHSLRGRRHHLLEVSGSITGGRLRLDWTYSENAHRRDTIEDLAQGFMEALRALIAHCQFVKTASYAPWDFALVNLDHPTLDQLTKEYPQMEDVYPLSPGQQEMLWPTLGAPQSGLYFLQWRCSLYGDLDVPVFKQVWQRVTDRHPVLRTAFIWEGTDRHSPLHKPLQIVQRQVRLPWEYRDLRGLSPTKQQGRLRTFLAADRKQGFELTKAPLMRFALFQMDRSTYEFIWSHHHLLLDGWSIAPIWQEVLSFYEAFHQNQDLHLEQRSPYRDYIAWLQQQDLSKAEVFWQKMLRDVTAPTPVGEERAANITSAPEGRRVEQRARLSAEVTAHLQSLARQHRLTLNTLVQGVWALLLSRYSGQEDVVFGVTVSGRPADLAGVESMIGLFINTLPMRVRVSPELSLLPWLKTLQEQQVELSQYEYSPLTLVKKWGGISPGLPLFESFLRFQNYPLGSSMWESTRSLRIQDVQGIDWWHYPLGGVVEPGPELLLWITYDPSRFDAVNVAQMLRNLQSLLKGFAANPGRSLKTLMSLIQTEGKQE